MQAILLGRNVSPEIKAQMLQQYQQRNQPIVIPYDKGKVLVHPTIFREPLGAIMKKLIIVAMLTSACIFANARG